MVDISVSQHFHCIFHSLPCLNTMEIIDILFISGLFDNIYVNKCSHVGQDGIFRSDNVTLIIPDGNSIIRREENLSTNIVYATRIIPRTKK